MEQTVWMYFGVITIVLGFGIVGKLIIDHKEELKFQVVERSMGVLRNECSFVCDSATGTFQSVEVELPAGIELSTQGDKLCGLFKETTNCVLCGCTLREYELNLNTELALEGFDTHTYTCNFKRMAGDKVEIDCQG